MFPQNFMDELIARNDIADVVGSYVSLSRKGTNMFGLCPFHNEKTPSFSVAPDKQIYYCFGCHKGGGVINFIMEVENLSFTEAVAFLAKRANLPMPEQEAGEGDRLRRRILELNREAAQYYYGVLRSPEGQAVQAYLDQRCIRKKVAMDFGMGAAPDAWDSLLLAMTARGYTKMELVQAGLCVQNQSGRIYDKFRNRLMLPVIDQRGDVVGFGSRVIDHSEPKYMNTTETPVYSKRRVLYGLNLAKKSKRPNIILCEGNLDVVTLHQAGFDNAVASMGTALTVEQTRLLSRYTKELVLCYDNDSAGQQATQRALEILNNSEFDVKVLKLPNKMVDGQPQKQDADDFIKAHGAGAFEKLLSGSAGGIEFRMAQIAGKYDLQQDEQRIAYAEEVSQLLCRLENAVERDVYTVRAAEAAGFSAEAMRLEVRRAYKRMSYQNRRQQERRELNAAAAVQPAERGMRYENVRSAMAEEGVIRLLHYDDTLFHSAPPLSAEDFSSPLLGRIYQALWDHRGRTAQISALSAVLTAEEMNHLTGILQKPESTANAQRTLQDYIRLILEEKQKRQVTDVDPLVAARDKYTKRKNNGGNET